jgi:hypothetical protein
MVTAHPGTGIIDATALLTDLAEHAVDIGTGVIAFAGNTDYAGGAFHPGAGVFLADPIETDAIGPANYRATAGITGSLAAELARGTLDLAAKIGLALIFKTQLSVRAPLPIAVIGNATAIDAHFAIRTGYAGAGIDAKAIHTMGAIFARDATAGIGQTKLVATNEALGAGKFAFPTGNAAAAIDALGALGTGIILIDQLVTIIVLTITDFKGRQRGATTDNLAADTFGFALLAVLSALAVTGLTLTGDLIIDHAVTVVVKTIAYFLFGRGGIAALPVVGRIAIVGEFAGLGAKAAVGKASAL